MTILQKFSRDPSARWIMASLLAPIAPTLLLGGYFHWMDPLAGRMSWLALVFVLPLYFVFGPAFIFAYSRVVPANLFLSALGGFAIPALVLWMFAGTFWALPLWIGIFGALCGVCFDFLFHGLKFNLRIRLEHAPPMEHRSPPRPSP